MIVLGAALEPGPLHVLCLGAHPDDIEIGCGGTLLRLAERSGTTLHAAVLSGTPERRAEAEAAAAGFFPGAVVEVGDLPDGRMPAHWGQVKQTLEELAQRVHPQLILAPRTDDAHQDHRLVGRLVKTVWREALTLHYEIPKWDGDLTTATHYVSIDEATAKRKVELLNCSYPSQVGRDWWDDELFLGLMRLRGMENRSRYAEAFTTSKMRLAF